MQRGYQAQITERVSLLPTETSNNLERVWNSWKTMILESAKSTCGVSTKGGIKKLTYWWSDEIKRLVKHKKYLWQKYLASKTDLDYEDYKRQRTVVKNAVLVAKSSSWKDFGEKMETAYKDNRKLFYRILKRLRTDKECLLKFIKDRNGNLLTTQDEIMERWKQYFEELLRDGENQPYSVVGSNIRAEDNQPPTFLQTEGGITMGEMKAGIAN